MTYSDSCHPGTRPAGSLRLSKIAPGNLVIRAIQALALRAAKAVQIRSRRICHMSPLYSDNRLSNCINKKGHPVKLGGLILFKSLTMTYSHMGKPHTTIGDTAFHF